MTQQQALRNLASLQTALASSASEFDVAHVVLTHVGAMLAARAVAVIANDDGLRLVDASGPSEQTLVDWRELVSRSASDSSIVSRPIRLDGKTLGFIFVELPTPLDEEKKLFLRIAADACALAWQRTGGAPGARREVSIDDEARLRELFVHSPASVCVLRGRELRVVFASDKVAQAAGSDPQGKTLCEMFPELKVPHMDEMLRQIFQDGGAFHIEELEVQLRQGEPNYFDLSVRPFRGADGSVDGVVAFAYDISNVVRTRRAVEEMVERARLADQRKDEFLAMLGHELRNPLGPARTALVLVREALERKEEDPETYLQVVERQIANLSRLVDDLLDVSRITRGKVVLRKEPTDARDAVKRVVESLRPLLSENRRRLHVELPKEPAPVLVDAVRLEQVLANLLSNAVKFSGENGRLEATVEATNEEVVVTVKDDGIGISPHVLPRIFDLFEQAERGLDRAQGGLGIGLTIVRTLIEQHGGRVEAHSEGLGKGARFTVHLPRLHDVPSLADEVPPAVVHIGRHRLLVVDDSTDGAEMLAMLLRSWGHEVDIARDGPSALSAIADRRPEVVLLDIGLPGMDGYEVARRVRAAMSEPQPKLVALTGYGQESDRKQALASGFDEHLVKPVDFRRLREVIA